MRGDATREPTAGGAETVTRTRGRSELQRPAVPHQSRFADLWPFLVTSAAIALAYRPTLLGSGHIPYDIEYYHYPLLAAVKAHIAGGSLPLWDPYSYGGVPLLTNAQAAWLYPPHLAVDAVLGLVDGSFSQRLLQCIALLHVWIAGMGSCLLARQRSLSNPAVAFAGAFVVLAGETVSQSQHLGMVETFAWLPLAILVVERLQRGVTGMRVAALGVLSFLIVTAGFLPLVVSCAATLLAYAVTGPGRRSALTGTVAGLTLGAALAGAMLLPLLAVLPYFPDLYPHQALPVSDLVTTIVPNALGHWLGSLDQYTGAHSLTNSYYYAGAGAIVALPLALTSGRRVVRDALVAAVLLLLSFGASAAAIAGVFQGLPTVGSLYRPEDFAYVAMVPLTLVLARAFDRRPSRRQVTALAVFLVVLALVPLGTGAGTTVRLLTDAPRRELLGLLVACGLVLLAWRARDERLSRAALTLLAVVAVFELASTLPSRYFVNAAGPPARADATAPSDGSQVVSFLRRSLRPDERVAVDGGHLAREWTAFSTLWGLQNANGLQPQFSRFQLERVRALGVPVGEMDRVFPVVPAERPYLREMNVRFVVVSPITDAFDGVPGYTRVFEDPAYRVYRQDGAQTRAYTARAACVARYGTQADVRCPSRRASTTILSDTSRRIEVAASDRPRLLIAGEPYYPGWHASAGGRPLAVRRAGYLTAVSVPAGVERVTLRYRPPWLALGIALTLLCVLAVAFATVRWMRAR